MLQKNIGSEAALAKIKHYCAYQERSHIEVKEKLYSYGLYKKEVELIISTLIEENYLNEERFAIAFASGKFRIRKWGKVKIKYELKKKRLSEYCIKTALHAIDETDYETTLNQLFEAKRKSLKLKPDSPIAKQKIFSYLLQKGFESGRIQALFQND